MRRRRPHAFGSFADILQRPRPCEWYVGFLVLRLPTIRPNLRVTNLMKRVTQSADVYRPREGNSIPWSLPTGSGAGGFRIFSHFKMCKTEQNDAYATDEKPIAELVATGNFRKDRHASRLKPRAATGDLGEPPSELAADVRRAWEDIANVTPLKKSDRRIVLETAARLLAQTRNGEPVTPSLANQLLSALRMLGLSGGAGIAVNGSGGDGDGVADKAAKYFT